MQNEGNINRIKPALRTKGTYAGNWGAGMRKGGSSLNEVPANSRKTLGNFPTRDEYYNRLLKAESLTTDRRLLAFIRAELKKLSH